MYLGMGEEDWHLSATVLRRWETPGQTLDLGFLRGSCGLLYRGFSVGPVLTVQSGREGRRVLPG